MAAADPQNTTPPAAAAPATGAIPPFTPTTPPPTASGSNTFTPATRERTSEADLRALIEEEYRALVGRKPSDAVIARLLRIVRRVEERYFDDAEAAERAQHDARKADAAEAPATSITKAPSVATIVEDEIGDLPEALAHGVSSAAESLRSILTGSKLSVGEFSG